MLGFHFLKRNIMSLFNQSSVIAFSIFLLIVLLIFYPTPHMLFFAILVGSCLSIYQTYIVLMDKKETVQVTEKV